MCNDDGGVLSDFSDVSDFSQVAYEQVYTLEEINNFMDETFKEKLLM